MHKKVSIKKYITEFLKLPEDLVYQEPILTLLGSRQLRVENYQSLLEYQTNRIVIRLHSYRLTIEGKNLRIVSYSSDEMYISGNIRCISYA